MKSKHKTKILIVGGGRRGLASIEVLNEDREVEITAVIDINPGAAGVRLADRLGIETDTEWRKYLESEDPPEAILDLTDGTEIEDELRRAAAERGIEFLGGVTKHILSSLLVERQVQAELHRVSARMTAGIGLEELLMLILSSCIKSTKYDGGMIILMDESGSSIDMKSTWGLSPDAEAVLVSRAVDKLREWPPGVETISLFDQVPEGCAREFKAALCAPLRSRGRVTGGLVITGRSASRGFSGSSRRLLSTFANHSTVAIENIILYQKSRRLSVTDGLTGLYNHRYFQEHLETELSRAQRYDRALSLIIIDLDNFKEINDTYGHLRGDKILKNVSRYLKKAVRRADTVCRYGGDEFCVILPETPKEGAMALGERIRKGMSREGSAPGEVSVKVSLGVSSYPDDGVDLKGIIGKADGALYRAKEEGRDRICAAG